MLLLGLRLHLGLEFRLPIHISPTSIFLVYLEDWINVQHSELPTKYLGADTRFYEDIAMIKLRTPIEFTITVRPVCLPSPEQNYEVSIIFLILWMAKEN